MDLFMLKRVYLTGFIIFLSSVIFVGCPSPYLETASVYSSLDKTNYDNGEDIKLVIQGNYRAEEKVSCINIRIDLSKKIGDEILVHLLGVYNRASEIDFEKLPDKFILKCNHGCAYNILVNDKTKLNIPATKKQLDKWLKEDFSLFNAEPQYHFIPRKIICEKYLGENLIDYKFFCFNGHVEFYYVSEGLLNDRTAKMKHYLRDGSVAPFQREGYAEADFPFDENVKKMIEYAEILASDFTFVRVDFFLVEGKIYFAELTFTPGGGYNELTPSSYLLELGKKLVLLIK